MTGRASGSAKILADPPRDMVPIPIALLGAEDVAVLALLVNLPGRDIRSHVALRASIRFAGNLDREFMPRVARGAGSPATVRIHPAHALVRPIRQLGHHHVAQVGVERAGAQDLDP